MKEIFEDAKFGDKFIDEIGNTFRYIGYTYDEDTECEMCVLVLEGSVSFYSFYKDGRNKIGTCCDIVSHKDESDNVSSRISSVLAGADVMEKDLRKRFEEAAIKISCVCPPSGQFGTGNYEPAEFDEDAYKAALKGAEFGYKEAIKAAKEWLSDCIHNEEHISSHPYRDDKIVATFDFDDDKETILSNFERELNKLLEEKI